jgi:hypothetical protein
MPDLPEPEETTFRTEAIAQTLHRMREDEERRTLARREARKKGKLADSTIQRLRNCNPPQLQAAVKLCRQFLKDHRTPPSRPDCFQRGRKAVMGVTVGNQRYQLELLLTCGKAACKKCPHGPYLYGYHRDGSIIKPTYYGRPPYRKKAPRKVLAAIQAYRKRQADSQRTA